MLRDIEHLFSLYDPTSALSQLNNTGHMIHPDPRFTGLMLAADHGYHQTHGLFDPTIQPLWQALATGSETTQAAAAIGWNRVQHNAREIRLDRAQALTFNGIAQGFATDMITDHLTKLGMTETLVNIGEYRAIGGPFQLGLRDPQHGHLGTRTITNTAIATSSPAMPDAAQHIIHPHQSARWSTVSVEAASATVADYLSTALCLAPRDQIAEIAKNPDIHRITFVDFDGNLTTLET
jgi:thiamine biosynthesis lipoprotein